IAAVGDDVMVAAPKPKPEEPEVRFEPASGTSMATPQVAGVAGLLLAMQPDLKPSELKSMLKSSARRITGHDWGSAGMLHLDGDAAIRRLIPAPLVQPVYIANQADASGSAPGVIVAIELNPMTGRRAPDAPIVDTVIPLQFTIRIDPEHEATFTGR